MAPPLLYCSACGAANAPEHSACFACKQPLALHIAEHEQTSLLHNRYQVLIQVGTGGFGAVYKALDTRAQNRRVAIKQINLRGLSPQEVIEATDGFNREVRMLSTLSHAHLPRIHAHFTDPEHWYVVMDFIDGETLEHYLRDITSAKDTAIRALALDEVLDIGLQLCGVLTYLHTHQPPIIFRDLKPSNIMRTPHGQLYLIDFGIARYFTPGQARDTIPLGSPGYAAPEQYGRAQTTPRADIYSLGAVLHHLLSRHDPSETPFIFAPLRFSGSTGLSELETLVLRMVEQDIEQRPVDMAEVESILLRIRSQRSAEPRIWRPIPPGQIPPPPVLARGAYQPTQLQQQSVNKVAPQQKSRRKFIMGSLVVASSVALGGSLGGVAYWRYWHPARLAQEAGFPRQIPAPNSNVSTIAWSPDGQHVAFGLSDGSIVGKRLSNNNGFTITSSFAFNANVPAQPINLLAWSPDNTRLVAVSQPGQLQLWDVSLQEEQTLSIGAGDIKAVAWSPNNQRIAVIDGQGMLYLCSARTGAVSFQTELFGDAMAWSPDGTSFITGSINPYILQIWDVHSGQSLASISMGLTAAKTLIWSPDGQNIAALSVDGTLQVWDSHNSDSQVFSQQIATQQNQLAWSPDNRFLATIDDTYNLLLLDRSSGNTLVSAPISDPLGRGGVFPGKALTWLPDSQHIAVANNNMECWLWSLPWF